MIHRRNLLAAGAGLSLAVWRVAAAAGTPAAPAAAPARGPAPLTKAAVGYRDVPCDGKVCAQCVYFVFRPALAGDASPQSRCQMVAGAIAPAGWCQIWAPGGGPAASSG